MPQLQTVDLNPLPRTEKTTLEKTLEGFAGRHRENQIERQDTDALRDIYGKYQRDGKNLEDAIMAIQTRPGISPTARVNSVNQLLEMQKYNNERTKKAQAEIEKAEKKASNQRIIRDLETRRELEPGSLAAYEDNPVMAAQITKPAKETQANQPIKEDQLRRIQHVRSLPDFETAPPEKQYQMLTDNGVSKENARAEVSGKEKSRELQLKQKELEQKEFESDRKYNTEISRPIIKNAQQTIKDYTIEKGLTDQLRRDISSGNTSGLYPFIVDKLGLESFRNPESARFTNEVKNLFVGSLREIPGARPNQFIERFLSTAQPLIGRDEESNLSVLDLKDFVSDIRHEHARLELEMAKQDRNKYGYAKDDISERAWDAMGDYANRRQEKMALDIRERHEKDKDVSELLTEVIKKQVPPNTPLTPKMMKIFYLKNDKNITKAIEEAKKSGFVLPQYMD